MDSTLQSTGQVKPCTCSLAQMCDMGLANKRECAHYHARTAYVTVRLCEFCEAWTYHAYNACLVCSLAWQERAIHNMDTAGRAYQMRVYRDFNLTEVARSMKLSSETIKKLENGRAKWTEDLFNRYKEAIKKVERKRKRDAIKSKTI